MKTTKNSPFLKFDGNCSEQVNGAEKKTVIIDDKGSVTPAVIVAFVEGNRDAYQKICEYFIVPVKEFVVKLIGSSEEGVLVTDTVFRKVWDDRNKLSHTQEFKNYLFTCVQTSVQEYLREKQKNKLEDLKVTSNNVLEKLNEVVVACDEQIKKETKLLMEIAISKMPKQRQEVIKLHQEGFTSIEIANCLKISHDNVCSQVMKAAKEVAKLLTMIMLWIAW